MYTIGQVSEMFQLPVSTLRYYDKEGLFPHITRVSGIRKFSDTEIESLHMIECLKKSGMEIKEIKQFMAWCAQGPSTYAQRKELFENRRKMLEQDMLKLQKNMAMIQFKCWYYEQAMKDGNEDRIHQMLPDHLPADIQKLYDLAHS
ncbi:MerR family transcriptional regulator [Kineothrix sp. MSJ-39]|uniref:MerR family transcriptional regulator n=1 Tax=Kineothrix sp. MSJ-39 TaxID=2841533 RepID=UPI001C105938|nr:MerR family transcriptional regulator [Kineothrix sp. MSJ-39]MBU5430519.1 MerR family transcriptional regulator [Kineothrix sp. MSJ-39]